MAPYSQPGRSDVHVNRPLTSIAIAYLQSQDAFIADRAFPIVPVLKKSDAFFTFDRAYWFSDEAEQRAPGAPPAVGNYGVSTSTYNAVRWDLAKDLADEVRSNYDDPLDPEREMTEWLMRKLLIRKERAWASDFFTSSVWTTDQTGVDSGSPSTNQFSRWDRADSTPIEDIREGKRGVHQLTGQMPNKLVLGREVYDALLDHPDIVGRLDRGQTVGPAMVKKESLAALFELDEILVMDGLYNSAKEGQTASLSYIGGKSALLLHTPSAPGLYTPSAGYTFSWTGLLGAGALGARMKRLRMDELEADRLEGAIAFDHKLISADLGRFFITAVN